MDPKTVRKLEKKLEDAIATMFSDRLPGGRIV
jgi:hypothetical protein